MASAQLGLRIFLDDAASAGLDSFGLHLQSLGRLVGTAGAQFGTMNPLLQTSALVAAGAGLAFGAFAGFIAWSVKQSAELQDAVELMTTQVRGANEAITPLTDLLVTLADNSQYSATQVAQGFAMLGAGGATAADLLNSTLAQSMINLAVDMNETGGVTQSAKLLIDTMDEFGAHANDAAHYANVLDVSFKNGIPDISQLTVAFGQSSPTAHQLGVSVDELASYLDILARMMGSGSKAGTSLSMVMQNMENPTNKAAEAMNDLGIITVNRTNPALESLLNQLAATGKAGATAADGFQPTIRGMIDLWTAAQKANIPGIGSDFMTWGLKVGAISSKLFDANGKFLGLTNAFSQFAQATKGMPEDVLGRVLGLTDNKTALRAMFDIINNFGDVKTKVQELEQAMQGQSSQAQDAAQKNSTYNARMRELQTTIQNIGAAIGAPLRDALSGLMDKFNGMLGPLATMNGGMAKSISQFLLIGAAVAGVTFVVSSLIVIFTMFNGVVPIVLGIALAIAGLAAGISYVMSHMNQFQPVIAAVTTALKGIGLAIGFIGAVALANQMALYVYQFGAAIPSMIQYAATLVTKTIPALIQTGIQYGIQAARQIIVTVYMASTMIPTLLASAGAWLLNAAMMILAAAPIILLILLFTGMVIGVGLLIAHLGGLHFIVQVLGVVWNVLKEAFVEAGNTIKGALTQAIQQLQPTWKQMVDAFNQAKPALIILGVILGAVIATAIAVVVGLLRGLIGVLAQVIVTVINIVAGIIKAFMGIVIFFSGFWQLLHGLFTGNLTEIQQGFATMGNGIKTIVSGLWQVVTSLFVGAFNTIKALVTGFITGFIEFFQHLFDVLVGHSIVPDLVNAILKWIGNLGPQVLAFIIQMVTRFIALILQLETEVLLAITSFVVNALNTFLHLEVTAIMYVQLMVSLLFNLFNALSGGLLARVTGLIGNVVSFFSSLPGRVVGALSGLGSMLFGSGQTAMQMFANGLGAALGAVISKVQQAAQTVANFLAHHSPAVMGPLSDDDKWMGNMMQMHANEILKHTPLLTSAARQAAGAVQGAFTSPAVSRLQGQYMASNGVSGRGGTTELHVHVGDKEVANCVIDNITGQLKMNGAGRWWR